VADGDHILELGFEDAVGKGVLVGRRFRWAGACARAHVWLAVVLTCRSSLRRRRRRGHRSW
jgi:hypothetical protein